jgi:hypothetical protein
LNLFYSLFKFMFCSYDDFNSLARQDGLPVLSNQCNLVLITVLEGN